MTKAEIARRAGRHISSVRKHLNGRGTQPRPAQLAITHNV